MATIRARGNLSAEEINVLVRECETEVLNVADIKDVNTYTSPAGPSLTARQPRHHRPDVRCR